MDDLPQLVERAHALARDAGFPLTRAEAAPGQPSACLPGVGRFLAVLAAGCRGGRIAEMGTGTGVGAAWMLGLVRPGGRIVMDDVTPVRAQPEDSPQGGDDPKRENFFGGTELVSTEVVLPDLENSLLVGTRR